MFCFLSWRHSLATRTQRRKKKKNATWKIKKSQQGRAIFFTVAFLNKGHTTIIWHFFYDCARLGFNVQVIRSPYSYSRGKIAFALLFLKRSKRENLVVPCVLCRYGTLRNLGTPGIKKRAKRRRRRNKKGSSFITFFWACVLGAQKKSFYGEWMRKRDFWREIVAAACLSLSCPRLPIATFIDGFNTVFHLGLSWCGATLILGLYFNFCFVVYVVRKRHRLLGAPSPRVLLQGNLKKKEERKKERDTLGQL